MRWAGHVERMGRVEVYYTVFCWGNLRERERERERPLGRPRRRWENNIKKDLQEVGWEGMHWICLAQDRDRCRELVKAVMNLRVP